MKTDQVIDFCPSFGTLLHHVTVIDGDYNI
jgi:hypothetical protein